MWERGFGFIHVIYLDDLYDSIQITVEMEKEGKVPFLDILIKHEEWGSLSRMVYRKPTHTDPYLKSWSHNHHPAQMMIYRAH